MLMHTQAELDRHVESVCADRLKVQRQRIANYLKEQAEKSPKWEVHDILKDLAKHIEAGRV